MSIADKVKKLIDEAPVVSSGVNVNFGPLVVTPLVVRWKGRGAGAPDKFTITEYMEEHGIKDEDDIELSDNESFQLRFSIDVSDLNPSLNFQYEREVAIVDSSEKVKTDWEGTVLPSLVKVFGKDWHLKVLPNGKKPAPTLWVSAENVDSLKPTKEGGKNYGVPKFVALYKNRDECIKARDERYPRRDDENTEDEVETEEGFSDEIIQQTISLYESTRKNDKSTLKMLGPNPFNVEGDYDPQALLDAAKAAMK